LRSFFPFDDFPYISVISMISPIFHLLRRYSLYFFSFADFSYISSPSTISPIFHLLRRFRLYFYSFADFPYISSPSTISRIFLLNVWLSFFSYFHFWCFDHIMYFLFLCISKLLVQLIKTQKQIIRSEDKSQQIAV